MAPSREERSHNRRIDRKVAKQSAVWFVLQSWAALMKGHEKEGNLFWEISRKYSRRAYKSITSIKS